MQKQAPSVGRILVMVLFALSCFGILLYLWLVFGGSTPLKPQGYRFKVNFPEATQLAQEADVRISGVPVGRVKKKELDGESTSVECCRPIIGGRSSRASGCPEARKSSVSKRSPSSIRLMKDGMSTITGQPSTHVARLHARHRCASSIASRSVNPRFTSSNVAAHLSTTADGRLKLAFANPSGQANPVTIHARPTTAAVAPASFDDMFFDDIRTLYDLDAPETGRIAVEQVYSDYRKGDRARLDSLGYLPLQDLKVVDLDTGKCVTIVPLAVQSTDANCVFLLLIALVAPVAGQFKSDDCRFRFRFRC